MTVCAGLSTTSSRPGMNQARVSWSRSGEIEDPEGKTGNFFFFFYTIEKTEQKQSLKTLCSSLG